MLKFSNLISHSVFVGLIILTCAACVDGTTGPAIAEPNAPSPVIVNRAHGLSTQSYFNAKYLEFSTSSNDYPRDRFGVNALNADAAAFFRYPDGTEGLIASIKKYWQNGVMMPRDSAIASRIIFYRRIPNTVASTPGRNSPPSSSWQVFDVPVIQQVPPCIHPRKILMADFNGDSVPDFAIMCHGWDAYPFPGERSTILLSQGNGYILTHIADEIGFHHGGSTADFNGDGIPDIAMTTLRGGIRVFINDGQGNFTQSSRYNIPVFRKAFHVELLDLNGDGHFDVVAGSHEWEDSTRILINPGNNQFNNARVVNIPSVPGAGTIVDFLHTPANNSLYILRTGDGQSNGTVFYQGLWLQKYSLITGGSTVVFANPNWTDPRYGYPSHWLRWIVEDNGYIVSGWGNAFRLKIE